TAGGTAPAAEEARTRLDSRAASATSVRKLQRPLDGLVAPLAPQRIQKRVYPEPLQPGVSLPQRRFEPVQRLRGIAPLRVDLGVVVGRRFAARGGVLSQHRLGVRAPAELVVDDRQAGLALLIVRPGLTGRSRVRQPVERVIGEPAFCVGLYLVRI